MAQEIRSVETVCKIYPDGSAGILQAWDVTVTSGTEWYIPIGNLNGMEISDFHVYEGEGGERISGRGPKWTQENVRVWGFGYEGTVRVNNNTVILETTAPMKKDSRMIAMVRFDKGLLEPAVSRDIPFSKMEKKALRGSDYSSGRSFSAFWNSIDPRLRFAFWMVLPALLLLLYFRFRDVRLKISGKVWKESFFGVSKIDGYCREAPFDGRLAVSYYVLKCGTALIQPPKWEKNIIGAYLLKWISDGRVHPEKDASGKTILRIADDSTPSIVSSSEKKLFGYITAAAGENGILEKDELKRWSRNHPGPRPARWCSSRTSFKTSPWSQSGRRRKWDFGSSI